MSDLENDLAVLRNRRDELENELSFMRDPENHEARLELIEVEREIWVIEQSLERGKLKRKAAGRFGLPVEQVRFYGELTEAQISEVDKHWGIKPPRSQYFYAAKRDGGLVWDRVRIVELQR